MYDSIHIKPWPTMAALEHTTTSHITAQCSQVLPHMSYVLDI